MVTPAPTHTEHEDDPWTINIGDHPTRTDSPTYLEARGYMIAAVKLVQPWIYGEPPYQDHHGGGIWLRDRAGWLMVKGPVGCEWSAQYAGIPAKFEAWRKIVERVIAAFQLTEPAYKSELGMTDKHLAILHTPIVDAAGIALWVDSFWNASVPLPQGFHTGVIGPNDPQAGGVHYYPTPITDIQFIKADDFNLWVADPTTGKPVAVAPVAPKGSGDARVRLVYHPDIDVESMPDENRIFAADHPLAKAAFTRQETP